jgi:cytochrome c peroxidase
MNLPKHAIKSVIQDSTFLIPYKHLFGDLAKQTDDAVLVNIGKALAAFQETLVTPKTSFDHFRDAIANEDWNAAANYPKSSQRGLSLFLGKGNCAFCHSGPLFSNGEFHDAGVPYFIRPGEVDRGRHQGIIDLKKSPFTLASDYSDDPKKTGAWKVNKVASLHSNFGIFRVPSLRNVVNTAPYMHNGSIANLEAVVNHYSNINIERLHADGEAILKPLNLSPQEIDDLVSFLKSL